MSEQDIKENQGVLWKHKGFRNKIISNKPFEGQQRRSRSWNDTIRNYASKCKKINGNILAGYGILTKTLKMMFDIGLYTHVFDTWIRKEICLK